MKKENERMKEWKDEGMGERENGRKRIREWKVGEWK